MVLGCREVGATGTESIGPDMRAAFRVDQLHIYVDRFTSPPHTAFDDVTDTKLAAKLLCIYRFSLVGKGGGAGDYEAPGNPRQIGCQIVGDPISEILLGLDRSTGY
jgi:hypothetical protein